MFVPLAFSAAHAFHFSLHMPNRERSGFADFDQR